MSQVEQMYTEFKKWNTMMEIEVKAIKHINEKWVKDSGGRFYKNWYVLYANNNTIIPRKSFYNLINVQYFLLLPCTG